MKPEKVTIKINSLEFSRALSVLHDPNKQSRLIKDQIQLVQHRFEYIKATPLKVLTQDSGFHKTMYVKEQELLHCFWDEVKGLKGLPPSMRIVFEKGLYECLRNIIYNPELNFTQYELTKNFVNIRTVVCHIQIAAMNIISLMMIDEELQTIEEIRLFLEELFTYFLFNALTSAACVNNRVTQALSLHFSYMPSVVSSMMREKLKLIENDKNHNVENASFLNRLMTNFRIYFRNLEHYQQITEQHKVYDVIMFYKNLQEVDNASIELADNVMMLIIKNKKALIDFFNEIFSFQLNP